MERRRATVVFDGDRTYMAKAATQAKRSVACCAGLIDTILVSSNDSDLVVYGGVDCIYFYDCVERSCFWVKMFEHVLVPSPAPGAMDFSGWTYDRLLTLCLLSGHDYLDNVKGFRLKKVYALMCKGPLPASLLLALMSNILR